MNFSKVISIDFQYIWLLLKRRAVWILLSAVLAFSAGAATAWWGLACLGLEINDSYRATATVFSFTDRSSDQTMLGITALQTYSETIKSRRIAEKAKDLLGYTDLSVDEIYEMLSTDSRYISTGTSYYENNSVVIPVYADSDDKIESMAVANAAADAFVEEIDTLLGSDTVRVLDYAATTEQTEHADVIRLLIAAGCAAGAMLIVAACMILQTIVSPRVRTMQDISLYGQIPVLGVFPKEKKRGQ